MKESNKNKAAIEEAAKNDTGGWYEQQAFIRGAQYVIEHTERYELFTKEYLIKHVNDVANEAGKVGREIERKHQNNRKPIGIQETRELVRQMLDEEISFSRFVELINEGSKL